MFKKIKNYLSKPKRLAIVNAVLVIAAVTTNLIFQAFCRPTLWASLLLIICFFNTIIYPLLSAQTVVYYVSNFISGVSIGVFVYCILFLEHFQLFALFLIPFFCLGLIAFVPHFFVFQLLYKHLFRYKNKLTQLLFCAGMAIFMGTVLVFNYQYKKALLSMEQFKKSNFTQLESNFMTEKILGMYFKYHTEICEYDGWRPPLHEPALIIGQWIHGRQDPLSTDAKNRFDLSKRTELYKKFFPNERIKLDCSCAYEYATSYHNDPLFKRP